VHTVSSAPGGHTTCYNYVTYWMRQDSKSSKVAKGSPVSYHFHNMHRIDTKVRNLHRQSVTVVNVYPLAEIEGDQY